MHSRFKDDCTNGSQACDCSPLITENRGILSGKVSPFLKWPGGKRWFVLHHSNVLPTTFQTYIEPFLGGGSVFFHLKPKKAILGDTNSNLIDTYQQIKSNWRSLRKSIKRHQKCHNDDHYYAVRERNNNLQVSRASRMIYLNKTCFNGIYRVNREGQFNVPRGDRDDFLEWRDEFPEWSHLLQQASLYTSDFEPLVDRADKGDLIFADPPYTVRHNLNGFVKYNEALFTWEDQVRLSVALFRARNRGVKIIMTNANHSSIKYLYRKFQCFHFKKVSRFSGISAGVTSRKYFEELIIISDTAKA